MRKAMVLAVTAVILRYHCSVPSHAQAGLSDPQSNLQSAEGQGIAEVEMVLSNVRETGLVRIQFPSYPHL